MDNIFNNLRKLAAQNFNELTDYLDSCTYVDPISTDTYFQDITPDKLQELCTHLGNSIAGLLAVESSGKEDIENISDQVVLHHYRPV